MDKETEAHIPPAPISADEAAFRMPPPSYEEIMGVYQTSVKVEHQNTDISPLAYIDIMPRCLSPGNIAGKVAPKFDDFSTIIEAANNWLLDNPVLAVWKCESVDRKLNPAQDGTIRYELNEMLRHDATFGFTVYIKGIRLWLTQNSHTGSTPQQLGIRNIVPEQATILVPTRGYCRPGIITIGTDVQITNPFMYQFSTFEDLAETMDKLNARLAQDPIPGTILTIETDNVKAYEGLQKDFDPERTCWSENKDKSQRNTQIIRIFYIKGDPAMEEIGYAKFIPEVTEQPETVSKIGKFEPFDNVIVTLGQWVSKNQGVRVVNVQQYDANVKQSGIIGGKLTVSPDSTDDTVSSFSQRRMARTLRVFHTNSPPSGTRASTVTSRLFLPVRTGRRAFETMTQTMERIAAWLRVTGVPIYSVETMELLFNETNAAGADHTKSEYTVHAVAGKHWLTAIRVYFSATYNEPDPILLPPLPVYKPESGSCSIL